MQILTKCIFGICIYFVSLAASADDESKRMQNLTKQLRCTVCQNQSVYDSNSAAAEKIKNRVQELIIAGASNTRIKNILQEEYGNYIFYQPPLHHQTYLLWLGPIGIFITFGIIFAFLFVPRRQHACKP